MYEASRVLENLHTRFEQGSYICERGFIYKTRVGAVRDHYLYVYAAERGSLQGVVYAFVRQEIRCLYVNVFHCTVYGMAKRLHYRLPVHVRPAPYHLNAGIVMQLRNRKEPRRFMQFLAGIHPVGQEKCLQPCNAVALEPDMRVAPISPFQAFRIAVGDIEPSQIADFAVYDQYLAVVAVIQFIGEIREPYFEERLQFDSRLPHFLDGGTFQMPRAEVVVYQPYFDSLPHFFYQGVFEPAAGFVRFYYIVFDVYVVGGFFNIGNHAVEQGFAVVENVHIVVGEQFGFP